MKIRHDPVAISSVLFTIALLIPLPGAVGNVWTGPRTMLDIAGHVGVPNYYAGIGFVCLTVIIVGLIVIWAAYINGARWTWFVLFLIAFAWALPVFVLAEFHWRNMMPIAQWPPYGPNGRGLQLGFTASMLTFVLMMVALALHARTFLLGIVRVSNHGKGGFVNPPLRAPGGTNLKIRRVALVISSVLFTIALLIPAQEAENYAEMTHQSRFRDISNDTESPIPQDQIVEPNSYAPIGMGSLAVIAIGLLVTWAGYFRGARWAWCVMLVIVWLWAFPVLVAPIVFPWQGFGAHLAWIPDAIQEVAHNTIGSFLARAYLERVTMFVLMFVALVLPGRAFLRGSSG